MGIGCNFQKMEPRCGQSPSRDTPLLHNPYTTRQIQEKLLTSERGCNTKHSSKAREYNLQYSKFPLQLVQGNVYTMPLNPIKEPPSSNEGNSNIAAQCAPTLQSIPAVEKVKIK